MVPLKIDVVPLKINDRLEPLPENRPPLSGPPEAEIEISPSNVGLVDQYIRPVRWGWVYIQVGSKFQSIDLQRTMGGRMRSSHLFEASTWTGQHGPFNMSKNNRRIFEK